jgi:hypothetical protein
MSFASLAGRTAGTGVVPEALATVFGFAFFVVSFLTVAAVDGGVGDGTGADERI